ncbi:MAG: NACHT domain-containing protein, partial [Planctomycetes bacterium]|nr:NACHT domain-containing protein [Planctomycetota bacterium]
MSPTPRSHSTSPNRRIRRTQMVTQPQRTPPRLTREEALQALTTLREQGDQMTKNKLTRSDRASLEALIELLRSHDEVPVRELLKRLWPRTPAAAAASTFRSFKERMNDRFRQLNLRVRLEHPKDNRPLSEKNLWLERALAETEIAASELAERFAREQKREYHDTPREEYVPQEVATELPVVRFQDTLRQFAEQVATEHWASLNDEQRDFLCNLSTILQPIVQLVPPIPDREPPVVAFECLALSPTGGSFGQVLKAMPQVDGALIRCLLAIGAAKTANALRSDAQQNGVRGAQHLIFTINLDPPMLASPYFEAFLERFPDLLRHNVVFEVNEETAGPMVKMARRYQVADDLRFALDDLSKWDAKARQDIETYAEMTKLDVGRFQEIIRRLADEPKQVIRDLAKYAVPGKPLVVEGVEQRLDMRFLEGHWPLDKLPPLYAQGHGIEPHPLWSPWLADARHFGLRGGQILASPFLAEATRIVSDFLTEAERPQLRRHSHGPVYRLDLPGSAVGTRDTFKLAVVSDRVEPLKVSASDLADADCIVVKQRDARLAREQLTLAQLPSHLRSFRSLPGVGAQSLRKAPLPEQYVLGDWVHQEVREGRRDRKEGSRESEIKVAGLSFLLDWLTSPAAPFCALLGDYGMGKTFLSRVFTNEVLERRSQGADLPVPLYLDMRALSPDLQARRVPELEDMVVTLCRNAGFPDVKADAVLAAVRLGHVALIFDGFDEKAAHLTDAEATALMDQIRRAAPKASNGKVLIACRTHYFEDTPHEREKVGGGALTRTREGRIPADFRIVHLQPFDQKRIQEYLQKLFHENAERIFDFLGRVHDLMDLSQRPFLLFLITQHLAELEALAARGQHIGAADVYQAVMEEWIRRDTGKHEIPTDVKVAFMEELARRLFAEERKQINFKQLRAWLQTQMKDKMPAVSLQDFGRADADLRTATFIVRDPEGNYRFAHTSFQEFFLARYLAASLSQRHPDALALPRLPKEVVDFTVDSLHGKAYQRETASLTIQTVLEQPYVPQVSENALLLWLAWRQVRPESAPEPARFELQGAKLAGLNMSGVRMENVDFS